MLRALPGHQAKYFPEAVSLALKEAGKTDIQVEIVKLFVSALEANKLSEDLEKNLNSIVHRRYGNHAQWQGPRWLIPIPELRFESQPLATITFISQSNLVAALTVRVDDEIRRITVIGTVGKPEKIILPLVFLQSLLDDNPTERFRIIGRDAVRTSWLIPGFKDAVWLPNDFINELSFLLTRKSVAAWLLDFGSGGRKIAPLVVGTLLGWLFMNSDKAVSINDRPWNRDTVIQKLTLMYGSAVAVDKFQKRAHLLTANMTNHEALGVILGGD